MIQINALGPNDQCARMTNVDRATSSCIVRSRSNLGVLSSSRINLATLTGQEEVRGAMQTDAGSQPLRTKRIALLKNTFAQSLAWSKAEQERLTPTKFDLNGLTSRKSTMPTVTRRGGATDKASKTSLSTAKGLSSAESKACPGSSSLV